MQVNRDELRAICRFAIGVLEMAMSDLEALLTPGKTPEHYGCELTDELRRAELEDLRSWLFDDHVLSAKWICDVVGRDVAVLRRRVGGVIAGALKIRVGRTQLSDSEVRRIRDTPKSISTAQLAREHSVAAGYMSRIRNGERRKEVA